MIGTRTQRTCVVVDLETQELISGTPGVSRDLKVQRLQVSVACALVLSSDDIMDSTLSAHEVIQRGRSIEAWRDRSPGAGGPFADLFACLDAAEVIVAYNGLDFDLPVLRKYIPPLENSERRYRSWTTKTHDPFMRLRATTGEWPSLDKMLVANSLQSKTSSGVEAVKMWEEQRRDELLSYCKSDVDALARLVLLPTSLVRTPRAMSVPAHLVSLRSALASVRVCPTLENDAARMPPLKRAHNFSPEHDLLFIFEADRADKADRADTPLRLAIAE